MATKKQFIPKGRLVLNEDVAVVFKKQKIDGEQYLFMWVEMKNQVVVLRPFLFEIKSGLESIPRVIASVLHAYRGEFNPMTEGFKVLIDGEPAF